VENVVAFADKRTLEEQACRWILLFEEEANPNSEQIEAFRRWLQQSPQHREALLKFNALWQDLDLLSELMLPLQERQPSPPRVLHRLLGWLLAPALLLWSMFGRWRSGMVNASQGGQPSAGRWLAISCVVTVAIALASSPVWYGLVFPEQPPTLVTSVGEQTTTQLTDGSVIWLNTDSKVEVDFNQQRRRIELVKGEAYFKVKKDKSRPFEVYANARLIRAVGTAFSVYKDANSVRVTVAEGVVDVGYLKSSNDNSHRPNDAAAQAPGTNSKTETTTKTTIKTKKAAPNITQVLGSLSAGQSVTLADGDNNDLNSIKNYEHQELARQLSWRDGLLVFAGEPLSKVVKEVSRYTSVKITLADPELESLRIGGQFKTGETEALFDILESGFGLKISRLSKDHVEIGALAQDETY